MILRVIYLAKETVILGNNFIETDYTADWKLQSILSRIFIPLWIFLEKFLYLCNIQLE